MSSRRGNLEAMDVVIDPNPPAPPPGQDELPCDDGEPMETIRHRDQMTMLIEGLVEAWPDRDDYFVSGNMFVYFSELQSRGEHFRGPDVFVVLDTDRHKVRKSWVAWQEGGKLPDVVIELLSDSTAAIDRGEKKRIYERIWKTQYYVLFDPETNALEGFELVGGRYVEMTLDGRGALHLAQLEMSLVVAPGTYMHKRDVWLRWLDRNGRIVPTVLERADAAQERADAAEKRVAELEARLRGQ